MQILTRWNPTRDIRAFERQIDRLFEPWSRFEKSPNRWSEDQPTLARGNWIPPVDVEETEQNVVLRAEIPGVKPEDVTIEYENGLLTIRGERKLENEQSDRNFQRIERCYGSFTRSFTVPNTIDTEHAEARIEDGVLHLALPKRPSAMPRRIEVRSVDPAHQVEAAEKNSHDADQS